VSRAERVISSGLIARTAALRELHEETGYGSGKAGGTATVEDTSSVMVKDPGYAVVSILSS
jgi:ADP-ribose pyrophosphatase